MKKRLISIILAAATAASAMPVFAANGEDSIILMVNENSCYINGEKASVGDVNPTIVESRTLVPVRFLAQSLGGSAAWDDASRTAILQVEKDKLEIPIDQNSISINGKAKALDVGATIIDGRTMMPLRSICEALGKNVAYDSGMILIGDGDVDKQIRSNELSVMKYSLRNSSINTSAAQRNLKTLEQLCQTGLCINASGYEIPYSSPRNTCLFTSGGMYFENLDVKNANKTEYNVALDVYNTEFSYGAAEVYDADGNFIRAARLDPFDGGAVTGNIYDYATVFCDEVINIKNAAVYKDLSYLEYKAKSVSHYSPLSINVPKDGYLVLSVNGGESNNVELYNMVHLITESLSIAVSALDLKLSGGELTTLKDALADYFTQILSENTELYAELSARLLAAVAEDDFTPWNSVKKAGEYSKAVLEVLTTSGVDIGEAVTDAAKKSLSDTVQSKIVSAAAKLMDLGSIKFAFDFADNFSKLCNYICFIMDLNYTYSMKSVIFDFSHEFDTVSSGYLLERDGVVYSPSYRVPGIASYYVNTPYGSTMESVIYNGRVYFASKDAAGTSDFNMCICSENFDGLDVVKHYDGGWDFSISENKLFIHGTNRYCDLEDGSVKELDSDIMGKNGKITTAFGDSVVITESAKSGNNIYYTAKLVKLDTGEKVQLNKYSLREASGNSFYAKGDRLYAVKDGTSFLVYDIKGNAEEIAAYPSTGRYDKVSGIVLANDKELYFETMSNSDGCLKRLDLKTGAISEIDRRMMAGGGVYFTY